MKLHWGRGGSERVRENQVGTMVTLVSDRQRMVPIKVANFPTRVRTLTGSPRTENHVFLAGERQISGHQLEKICISVCHFLFKKSGLFFFCISTCMSMHANTSPLSQVKWPTHHSWQIWKHTNSSFGSYLGTKPLLILLVVFSQQSDRTMTRFFFFLLTLSDSILQHHQWLHCCKSWRENRPVSFLSFFLFFIWGKGVRLTLQEAFSLGCLHQV